jgi:hypothetical protein
MRKIRRKRRFLKGKSKESYRPGWRFPQLIEHEIIKWILHPCLHVCSGQSPLGDIKLDLYERADIRADHCWLPIRSGHFRSIIWDPPYEGVTLWNTKPALIQMKEALPTGGRLISLHYLDPSLYLKRSMRLIAKFFFEPAEFRGLRVLTVLEKLSSPRISPRRMPRLISMPIRMWEPDLLDDCSRKQAPFQPRQISEQG